MLAGSWKKNSVLIYLLPFLLLGCTEGSLLVPDLSEDDPPELATVDEGTILSESSVLPISLPENDNGGYTRLEITIRTPEGEVVYSTSYESEVLSDPILPDLPMPDLEEGTYLVELVLFEQQLEVARKESLFFLTDAIVAIQGITLYPPTSEPEAQLIAEAHLSRSSQELDPYLRWRLGPTILQEGLLSEEGATARVETSDEAGAFTLILEVFPWAPPAGVTYEFRSPITLGTDVIVRSAGKRPSIDSYLAYGFNGHGRAAGSVVRGLPDRDKERFDWKAEGEPLLTVKDEVFGYELGGENRFQHNGFILPTSESGELLPFRLDLLLMPLSLNSEPRSFLVTRSDRYALRFGFSGSGEPYMEFLGPEGYYRLATSVAVARVSQPVTLGFALYPDEEELFLQLFSDDLMLQEVAVPRREIEGNPGATVSEATMPDEAAALEEEVTTQEFRGTEASDSATSDTVLEQRGGTLPESSPSESLGSMDAPGTRLGSRGSLRFIIDELSVHRLDEAEPAESETRISLEPGEFTLVELPDTPNEIHRYTLLSPVDGAVLFEQGTSEDSDSYEPVAALTQEESVEIKTEDEALFFSVDEDEWTPIENPALRLRVDSESEGQFVVERQILR